MKNVAAFAVVIGLLIAFAGYAEEPVSPSFSLELIPQLSIPLGRDFDVFSLGGGTEILARLPLPIFFLAIEAGGGFEIAPISVADGKAVSAANLMMVWPWAGLSLDLEPFSNFTIQARVNGGYYFASLDANVPNNTGSNPMFAAGVGIGYRIIPNLSLGIGANYRYFIGLYNDVAVTLGTTYHFLPPRSAGGKAKPYTNLIMEKVELEQIFPVMYKYYDDHAIGKIQLRNTGKIPMENVTVSVFVNQYMDNPKAAPIIPFLKGGETADVDLYALFNDKVMGITEATKVQASIAVASSVAGEDYGNERVETLRIYDRNAITWTDDRRVAAFVVAKDPTVQRFAKNVASVIKDKISGSFDGAFLKAMAIHEALRLFGLAYQVDPSSPYSDNTKKSGTVDYLQYPSQTLEFKAGDCDDLTILNASLLESLGVETAFITVPGHIFMAYAIDTPAEEAAKSFLGADNLIMHANKAWMPVEITLTQGDFMKAWDTGAQEWREGSGKGQAAFLSTHDAWELYEPVGFTRDLVPVNIPDERLILEAFRKQVDRYVELELLPQVSSLKEKMKAAPNNRALGNQLGVLYARFGQNDNAEAEFLKLLTPTEYAPALNNLGNLARMTGNLAKAREYFERANRVQPGSAAILLNLARTSYEMNDLAGASLYFTALEKADSQLAARFAYLGGAADGAGSTARAADAERMKGVFIWSE